MNKQQIESSTTTTTTITGAAKNREHKDDDEDDDGDDNDENDTNDDGDDEEDSAVRDMQVNYMAGKIYAILVYAENCTTTRRESGARARIRTTGRTTTMRRRRAHDECALFG